jgi:hypothetical protein
MRNNHIYGHPNISFLNLRHSISHFTASFPLTYKTVLSYASSTKKQYLIRYQIRETIYLIVRSLKRVHLLDGMINEIKNRDPIIGRLIA